MTIIYHELPTTSIELDKYVLFDSMATFRKMRTFYSFIMKLYNQIPFFLRADFIFAIQYRLKQTNLRTEFLDSPQKLETKLLLRQR